MGRFVVDVGNNVCLVTKAKVGKLILSINKMFLLKTLIGIVIYTHNLNVYHYSFFLLSTRIKNFILKAFA